MARSHMNMPIICVRSFCGVNEVPDFTNCKRVPGRAYNGANGKKIAIEHQGEQYMLKFPPSGQGKRTELSYTNSCISEHIASTIFNMVGIPAQETILGTYDVGGKTKIVCACKDFTADGSKLFDFCSIKNTVIDSEYGGTGTELEDILDTIEKQQYVNPVEVLQHFWNVFVVDALLGNFDRHNGNWRLPFMKKQERLLTLILRNSLVSFCLKNCRCRTVRKRKLDIPPLRMYWSVWHRIIRSYQRFWSTVSLPN